MDEQIIEYQRYAWEVYNYARNIAAQASGNKFEDVSPSPEDFLLAQALHAFVETQING